MTATIGNAVFSNLNAQPFGYEESDTRRGLTARQWVLSGVLDPVEWLDLVSEYDTWRDARILDEDSKTSGTVGTTVSFSGNGPGGEEWAGVECWFVAAPTAEQVGAKLVVSVSIVDAAQALEVLLREEEISEEEEGLPDLGTVEIGNTTLTLLKPMETYGAAPVAELTAGGVTFITGPLVVSKVRDIEGTTDAAGWTDIQSWFESIILESPLAGDWYPISVPTAGAANKIVNGIKQVEYTITIQLGLII